jgi:hypothetical protein
MVTRVQFIFSLLVEDGVALEIYLGTALFDYAATARE